MDLRSVFVLALTFIATSAQESDPHRLSRNVIPSYYKIDLTLLEDFYTTKVFYGIVEITVDISNPTSAIRLNSVGITYPEASVTINNTVLTVEYDPGYEQINLTTTITLPSGRYIIRFNNYTGTLHEDMSGFYLSSYTTEDNVTEYIATTQFQATYARRAFPSFDEPNFKAVFEVSITRPPEYHSLANTNVTTVSNTDSFSPSPVMSSYLLAFIVSKFKGFRSNQDGERQQYDVWCREEALPTANYSYVVGVPTLERLDELTGIPYYDISGVEKMDQVAIPDFAAGAMENWGLVTYRETGLLWHPTESTALNKQRIAAVIAHEFAHMWFGNLVTMDWWEYTWLNEGFARLYQYFITAQVETGMELEKQFIIEQQQAIFANDAVVSAAALNSPASSPSQISNKFASTSYNKGASVIKMMANFLGQENYVSGIREYLEENSFSNTVPEDLYTALARFAPNGLPANLSTIMTTWTAQAGYPVVSVARNESALILTQERFLLNSSATSNLQWYVPITFTTQESRNFDNTTVTNWLLPSSPLIIPTASAGWVVVNILESGYYRVNYDDELWDALQEALNNSTSTSVFPEINRAQIVDDVLNLARANRADYNRAFNVIGFLANDVSYFPWYSAFTAFSFLRRRIDSTSYVGQTLQKHILELSTSLRGSVSFNTAALSHVNILKTALTLQWACELGEERCIEEANTLFQRYVNGTGIDANVKSIVYCSALRHAEGDEYWNFLWNKYRTSRLATEQAIIMTALGCSRDEEILKEYLRRSITEGGGIRKQDGNSVFTAVLSGNPENVNIAFDFLSENVVDVANYYEGLNALTSVINGIADRLTTEEQINRLSDFIRDNAEILRDAAVSGAAAVETARANLQWTESKHDELNDWLYETYGSATTSALSIALLIATLAVAFFNH